jgi:hypothetical protein
MAGKIKGMISPAKRQTRFKPKIAEIIKTTAVLKGKEGSIPINTPIEVASASFHAAFAQSILLKIK